MYIHEVDISMVANVREHWLADILLAMAAYLKWALTLWSVLDSCVIKYYLHCLPSVCNSPLKKQKQQQHFKKHIALKYTNVRIQFGDTAIVSIVLS